MKRKALRLAGMISLLASLICLVLPWQVAAQGIAELPTSFYGDLKLSTGEDAPPGVTVKVMVDGVECDSIITSTAGKYGDPSPGGDLLEIQNIKGRLEIKSSSVIEFFVNGQKAVTHGPGEAKSDPGETIRINLSYTAPPSGGGGGGGGGAPPPTSPSPTPTSSPSPTPTTSPAPVQLNVNVNGSGSTGTILSDGKTVGDIVAVSSDRQVQFRIPAGSTVLSSDGQNPPESISIQSTTYTEDVGENSTLVLAYECQPSGTTFDPPGSLVWHYDANNLPAGITEADLEGDPPAVRIVVKLVDENGNLVEVPCTLDPETNTVTVSVSHFSTFIFVAVRTPATPTTTVTTPAATFPAATSTTPAATPATAPASETPEPDKPSNWGLIIGIVVAAIVVIIILFAVLRRKPAR